jgi:hypothetical protein
VFWFAAGVAFIGVLFVPFLRITTQGHKGDTGRLRAGLEDGHGLDGGLAAVAVSEKGVRVEEGPKPHE